MGLNLSTEDITLLEARTEGWIAGLQLAAVSMQGHKDSASFIKTFSGSHNFVLDYLIEEVLQQQSESIQNFLLRTSVLDRLCGPLCDAVLQCRPGSGQETLEFLERANLFIIPLDNERHWYRYHHLFADLLRQRLLSKTANSQGDMVKDAAEYHIRASRWYEENGFELEAFQHAVKADDIERAERLADGKGISMHYNGAVTAILDWLASLPRSVLDARPSLWAKYAALMLVTGRTKGVEEKLQAAEAALKGLEKDSKTKNLTGQIAAARATLALTQYQVETMIAEARRALEYLSPDNLTFRSTANWVLGVANQFQGERAEAGRAFTEAVALSRASGDIFTTVLATAGLGLVQESENELYQAADTYRLVMQFFDDHPQPHASEVYHGLARILYEWNDLDAAEFYGQKSLRLAQLYDKVIDRSVICEVFLARVKLARGDTAESAAILDRAEIFAHKNNFAYRIPEIAAAKVLTYLRQGKLKAASDIAKAHELPMSQARVFIALGNTTAALTVLEALRLKAEVREWKDECLKVKILQAIALNEHGEKDMAMELMADVLALAKPGGFIRIFADEGAPMARLLLGVDRIGIMTEYIGKLLSVFKDEEKNIVDKANLSNPQPFIEQLSQRELEVLQLIAQGLSNDEIGKRLFLALPTVKWYNQNIFGKLGVQRRTEAVARARQLGLL